MKRISQLIFKHARTQSAQKHNTTASHNHSHSHQHAHTYDEAAAKISTCQMHDESKFPNLKALEQCHSCNTGMCYMCANEHADDHHSIDWGLDIFDRMEAPKNEVNELFNQGYRAKVDLTKLRCPCGNKIIGSKTATICSACGTATCSAECHDKYVQSQGKCLFIRNFVKNEQTRQIQGLRNILWINQYAMIKDNFSEGTYFSRSSNKFITASLGDMNSTIYLQRGWRQYGQPHDATLEAFVEIEQNEGCKHYQEHQQKLCMCDCEHCSSAAPHSVFNCFFKCKSRLVLDDKTMNKLGLHTQCHCQCHECIRMPGHMKSDCFDFCKTSPFNK